jgi:hypothetical protein
LGGLFLFAQVINGRDVQYWKWMIAQIAFERVGKENFGLKWTFIGLFMSKAIEIHQILLHNFNNL